MSKEDYSTLGFICFVVLYIITNLSVKYYCKIQIQKYSNTENLAKLRHLEKQIKKGILFRIILPDSISTLENINRATDLIHRNTQILIDIDYDFLLQEARDEYNNLNGLTTSEGEDEDY